MKLHFLTGKVAAEIDSIFLDVPDVIAGHAELSSTQRCAFGRIATTMPVLLVLFSLFCYSLEIERLGRAREDHSADIRPHQAGQIRSVTRCRSTAASSARQSFGAA
ncbi:hypothetical protein D3227_33610 [Mesorhizobium waimense]|uniref:Uncharacterized protein n=1 Tax=Mesorhizobium waimense TaxID=1300307 RepID=A0A3A5K8X7_9HYPH|nr:hypothetical protein D3227_33610 [Mesorhizobium waimense]